MATKPVHFTPLITGLPSAPRAEHSIHGPWQIAATGLAAATISLTTLSIAALRRM